MRTLLTILTMTGFLFTAQTHAAPIESWFEKANEFYEQSVFDSAVVYYEQILEEGFTNATIHYNLGNSYYRTGEIGPAILQYEKALKLDPGDPDIRANLRFANRNIVDRIPAPERGFVGTMIHRLHTVLPLGAQLWLLFSLLTLTAILYSLWLFASHNARLWLVYLSGLCIILLVIVGTSTGIRVYQRENIRYAVVLSNDIDALNGPNGNKVLFTAHEGTKFRIRKVVEEWSLVSLPNGVGGWVRNSTLGRI